MDAAAIAGRVAGERTVPQRTAVVAAAVLRRVPDILAPDARSVVSAAAVLDGDVVLEPAPARNNVVRAASVRAGAASRHNAVLYGAVADAAAARRAPVAERQADKPRLHFAVRLAERRAPRRAAAVHYRAVARVRRADVDAPVRRRYDPVHAVRHPNRVALGRLVDRRLKRPLRRRPRVAVARVVGTRRVCVYLVHELRRQAPVSRYPGPREAAVGGREHPVRVEPEEGTSPLKRRKVHRPARLHERGRVRHRPVAEDFQSDHEPVHDALIAPHVNRPALRPRRAVQVGRAVHVRGVADVQAGGASPQPVVARASVHEPRVRADVPRPAVERGRAGVAEVVHPVAVAENAGQKVVAPHDGVVHVAPVHARRSSRRVADHRAVLEATALKPRAAASPARRVALDEAVVGVLAVRVHAAAVRRAVAAKDAPLQRRVVRTAARPADVVK